MADADNQETLKIYGIPEDVVEREVDGKVVMDTIYKKYPAFSLTDQQGNEVTEKAFEGKITVVDFFFTSCPTICPRMTSNMLDLYEQTKDMEELQFISHSIDPEYDTQEVLKEYSDRLEVDPVRWRMLTGESKTIFNLAKSYMVTAERDASSPGGYAHSGAFILFDGQRRIRGFYDGTVQEKVEQLKKDLEILRNEQK